MSHFRLPIPTIFAVCHSPSPVWPLYTTLSDYCTLSIKAKLNKIPHYCWLLHRCLNCLKCMYLVFVCRFVCHPCGPWVRHSGGLHESCAQGCRFQEIGVQVGLQACINAFLCLFYFVLFFFYHMNPSVPIQGQTFCKNGYLQPHKRHNMTVVSL